MDRTSHSQSALPVRFELLNRRCYAVIFSTLSRVDDGGAQSCSGQIRFPTHEKGIRDRIRGLMRPDARAFRQEYARTVGSCRSKSLTACLPVGLGRAELTPRYA
jgi:hypothetical protein